MEQRIEPKVGVVIVAAGSGSRMNINGGEEVNTTPKQFRFIGQLPMLAHSINRFADTLNKPEIVVVLSEDRVEFWKNLSARFNVSEHKIAIGGSERFHSVANGLSALSESVEIIAVHDAARPYISAELIRSCITQALSDGSAIPAVELKDSIRQITGDGSQALDRASLRAVQTPQCFDAITLRRAYRQPYNTLFTDDASVVEHAGERVWLCKGEDMNIKITTIEDLDSTHA